MKEVKEYHVSITKVAPCSNPHLSSVWFSGYSSSYSVLPVNQPLNSITSGILNLKSNSTEFIQLLTIVFVK